MWTPFQPSSLKLIENDRWLSISVKQNLMKLAPISDPSHEQTTNQSTVIEFSNSLPLELPLIAAYEFLFMYLKTV